MANQDGQFNFNFEAHEETIRSLEDSLVQVEKDFIQVRERVQKQVNDVLEIAEKSRDE